MITLLMYHYSWQSYAMECLIGVVLIFLLFCQLRLVIRSHSIILRRHQCQSDSFSARIIDSYFAYEYQHELIFETIFHFLYNNGVIYISVECSIFSTSALSSIANSRKDLLAYRDHFSIKDEVDQNSFHLVTNSFQNMLCWSVQPSFSIILISLMISSNDEQ